MVARRQKQKVISGFYAAYLCTAHLNNKKKLLATALQDAHVRVILQQTHIAFNLQVATKVPMLWYVLNKNK